MTRPFRGAAAASLLLFCLPILCSLAFSSPAKAAINRRMMLIGTTGKLTGTVIDARTKEPLAGASVVIEGTRLGARADADGNYTILNIQPGTYRVRVSYIGYQAATLSNVGIRADYTERADFTLNIQDVQTTEVVVTAERPIVIKDQTSSVAVVTADEIRALPVENFDQVVQIQAGVVGGRFRGGRANEVAYLVDGISVQDVFDGSKGGANTVEPAQIQELQVITGAFNAEYGQALSGVVN
ncbi:MAG: carboxypeptidase-like regulatory domain-containing protein, partial [Rhizobacter sp.]|nr:carboxypeptidase-like regulatory domain-containing protein [Chlorobiales bacterium]